MMYFKLNNWIPFLMCLLFPSFSRSLGTLSFESTEIIKPGILHIHRQYTESLENIHILKIDLTNKNIHFRAVLGGEKIGHPEQVSSMVKRTGAIAGINGDYWSGDSIFAAPEGIMVSDGELITAPKFRTAIGINSDNKVAIGKWSEGFEWNASMSSPRDKSKKYHINLLNRWDLNNNSMILYTDRWSAYSFGTSRGSPETELLFGLSGADQPLPSYFLPKYTLDYRNDKEGIPITKGKVLIAGRGDSALALKTIYSSLSNTSSRTNVNEGPYIDVDTNPRWQLFNNIISAGPLIVDSGTTFRDPIAPFSNDSIQSEDFTLGWKKAFYLNRHPHTLAGVTKDRKTLILMTVDGRQKNFSQGFNRDELADYMISLGAERAMLLDSGGSTTMVIEDKVVNHPSDSAKPDGSGGVERKVINSLCIYYGKN